jgi:hypothetical protein
MKATNAVATRLNVDFTKNFIMVFRFLFSKVIIKEISIRNCSGKWLAFQVAFRVELAIII